MTIEQIAKKYHTRYEIIVKRKTEILSFSIKCGFMVHRNVKFYIDDEKISVGNKIINISDLKTMYIVYYKRRYRGYGTHASLRIIGKKLSIALNIESVFNNEDDIKKIQSLFEYFVFSNEIDVYKLTSQCYVPMIMETSPKFSCELNQYPDTETLDDETMFINTKEFYLYKILPKSYYNKYKKKKNYLLYESKYLNCNYMDVWINSHKFYYNKQSKLLLQFLCILFFGALCVFSYIKMLISNPILTIAWLITLIIIYWLSKHLLK